MNVRVRDSTHQPYTGSYLAKHQLEEQGTRRRRKRQRRNTRGPRVVPVEGVRVMGLIFDSSWSGFRYGGRDNGREGWGQSP
jgi:hypothetical protein